MEPVSSVTNQQEIIVDNHNKKQPIAKKVETLMDNSRKEGERPRSIPSEIINEIDDVIAATQQPPPSNKPRKRIRSRRRSDQQQQKQQQDEDGLSRNVNIYDQVNSLTYTIWVIF